MKRLFPVLLAALLLAGCASGQSINPVGLSQEQNDVVFMLIGNEEQVAVYDISFGSKQTSLKVWTDIYEKGMLKETVGECELSPSGDNKGRLAIKVNYGAEPSVSYKLNMGGAFAYADESYTVPLAYADSLAGTSLCSEKASPRDDDMVILYMCLYGQDMGLRIATNTEEQMRNVAEYDYAVVTKCRFVSR